MENLIHQLPSTSLRHAHCVHCRREIVLVPRVGWIDPFPGDSYDICLEDDHGRHVPEQDPSGPTPSGF